jgi:hypothetical protein
LAAEARGDGAILSAKMTYGDQQTAKIELAMLSLPQGRGLFAILPLDEKTKVFLRWNSLETLRVTLRLELEFSLSDPFSFGTTESPRSTLFNLAMSVRSLVPTGPKNTSSEDPHEDSASEARESRESPEEDLEIVDDSEIGDPRGEVTADMSSG